MELGVHLPSEDYRIAEQSSLLQNGNHHTPRRESQNIFQKYGLKAENLISQSHR